jgi:hypothetical protein
MPVKCSTNGWKIEMPSADEAAGKEEFIFEFFCNETEIFKLRIWWYDRD